ncbi:hypothetical protein THUN1379_21060 [Paludibacterium sp. THUN1379]|uniref:hypothetical protein n=1 Tax=Paludibacterium sp. THUN1379 TaxID=3112107 RepID=UPI0030894B38|nr:hypothetical protein THUN1379_21060 [Paludibacterium sp. THUN1379]
MSFFDIDLTSLLVGVSLTAVGGWIASFIAFRKDERAVQLEQITKERTKWRDNLRQLCEEIAIVHIQNRVHAIPEKVVALRTRLATSINPKDKKHDGAILALFDHLFTNESDDSKELVHRIALLLKHDWERVKWECTPLYIKPFKRFSKKQREWRQENYREIESTSAFCNQRSHISEAREKSQAERILLQLIDIKPEDVTLKFIFDNIRNYGIAATVVVAGYYLAQHGAQVSHFTGAGIVFGTLLIVSGISLYAINLCQAFWALVKLKIRYVPYSVFSMTIFLGTSELIWVLIKQNMHKG